MTWLDPWPPIDDYLMGDASRLDPERLAALIDGRLGESDAAEVRARLATADADTLAAFADAVALTGAADAAAGGTPSASSARSIAAAARAQRWLAPALGIAAVLVGVVVLQTWQRRTGETDIASGLMGHALSVPEWNAVRSGDGPVTERGRGLRLGVLLVQYELAARSGDDTAARTRAVTISALLGGSPGATAAAVRWRTIADGARPGSIERRADVDMTRAFADSGFVALGIWLERARSAARSRQAAWFESMDVTPLQRALASRDLTPAERDALVEIERAVRARPLDLGTISTTVSAAERAVGR